MNYVELHARSAFSFLEGASEPEALSAACAMRDTPAIGLIDRNGLYGSARIHAATKTTNVKAHVGAEITVAGNSGGFPLLVETRQGYQNLCRLITKTKLRVPKNAPSAATWEELEEHSAGLVCLTGDEYGPLSLALRNGGTDAGRRLLTKLVRTFGKDGVYVELQRHFNREQEERNQSAIQFAEEFGLPLLATNGVCYADPSDRALLDVFTCIKHKRQLATAGRLLERNSERYVRTPAQMSKVFADVPSAIANTTELSNRLTFTLEHLGYQFPRYPVPSGETMNSFLRQQTFKGAGERYRPITERVRQQLERELALIERLDLAGYFLIVWDLVKFSRENKILVQGRGSAANSAVCYSLGITAVDPIRMDLLFERFLSEERGEWPDIDLDLPSGDQREQVIQYVYRRYGERGAAMTANVITYRGRLSAREVGKVLGFDGESLGKLSQLVGSWEWRDPKDTLERQFKTAGFDLQHERIQLYMNLASRIRNLPRHLGQHSGGMVICEGQLDSVVPLEPASMPGRVVVQWDKDDCADLGIVKVDLLGLGMMAVLHDSTELIREHYGENVDLAHLPQNDEAKDVYEVIRRADTVGMFQIESRAQMASLPRNSPRRFYDLVTQVALIRPGPIVGKMTNPYLNRRQEKEPVRYPHPMLIPVLERTLGVPLFQEQLLRMAMVCASFSGGEAEELRRALGSRRSEQKMKAIEARLRSGMAANGMDSPTQDEVVQFISSFALYGFPESHSASFALLAYASAFLKVRYLAAFTAALLNNQPMGFYAAATIVKDAQRHGLKVKPIDVTVSDWNCTLERHGEQIVVRIGLRYVRGLSQKAGEALVRQRTITPFASIADLARRLPELDKINLHTLAQTGATNSLNGVQHRRDALWQVARAGRQVGPLLQTIEDEEVVSPLHIMDSAERLIADFAGTGLTIGRHPMGFKREELKKLGIKSAIELRNISDGCPVSIAGHIIARQRPGTAHGFIFLSIEDETGIANAIIQPSLYERHQLLVTSERFVIVKGKLQNKDGVIHVKADAVSALNPHMEGRRHSRHERSALHSMQPRKSFS